MHVVLLGGRSINAMNRWRVRIGVRSCGGSVNERRIVFCGGAIGSSVAEAELMAGYARRIGYTGRIDLETQSRSTWDNVARMVPFIETADRIKLVSNPTHGERARQYLVRQRPDLSRRLVRGADYRFGEWTLLKPALALMGVWKRRESSGNHTWLR